MLALKSNKEQNSELIHQTIPEGRTIIMPTDVNVLVVDDDIDIQELLADYLEDNGFKVTSAGDASSMHERIEENVPDVVLMDIGLPGEDGLSLTRYLREHLDIGVIVISGSGETLDRIIGLEVGADDYIPKPFDPRELRARIKNVIRRYQRLEKPLQATQRSNQDTIINLAHCRLNIESHQLLNNENDEIPLTAMEFDLLKTFIERPNRPLTRDQLLNITQNRDWDPYDRSIDIRITRLRRKLEQDPNKPQIIRTVRGVGYMYVPTKAEEMFL